LVKARIQAYSPAFPVGAQHYYKNSMDALTTIMKSDGVLGLWRGVNAAFLRTAMVSFFKSVTFSSSSCPGIVCSATFIWLGKEFARGTGLGARWIRYLLDRECCLRCLCGKFHISLYRQYSWLTFSVLLCSKFNGASKCFQLTFAFRPADTVRLLSDPSQPIKLTK
jgi:hypothetical protein